MPDVVVVNNGGPPVILHNKLHNTNQWLGLNLVGLQVGANITWSAGGVVHSLFHRGGAVIFPLRIHAIFWAWESRICRLD